MADFDSVYPHSTVRQSDASTQGFFRVLFDLDFKQFITLKFAKFLYLLTIGLLALIVLVLLMSAFSSGNGILMNLMVLIVVPAAAILVLIGVRLGLEFAVSTIRTSQNTTVIADHVSGLQ